MRLFVKCISMRFSLFYWLILFKTLEFKSMRFTAPRGGGWVVAVRLDEPQGRGDTNKTASHSQVWLLCSRLKRFCFGLWRHLSFCPAALCHQPQYVRLMKFLHGRGFTSRLLQPAHFTGTAPTTQPVNLLCQDKTAFFLMREICVCLPGLLSSRHW